MRVFVTALLSMSLVVSPLLANAANDAKDAGKEDAVESSAPAAKAESAVIESQLEDLRSLVQAQMQQLEEQRASLKAQQLQMNALEERLHSPVTVPNTVAATPAQPSSVTFTPTSAPAPASVSLASTTAVRAAMAPQKTDAEKDSPLYFKIGAAEFYPLGFMDLTSIYRTRQLGGIGTNFGGVAFGNTVAGRLSEERLSAQNSRIGLRTHAKFGDADVTGYLESDFLGFLPPNGNDTSNSNSLRLRLYWVNYKRGKFEVLGGQSWSFLTPNRNGLSALPADLFYSQDVDTNYQLGLTWARQTGIRFIAHPTNNWAIGLALENPQQTLPSSVVVPAAAAAGYASQFDSNSGNTSSATGVNNPNTPNLHPDVIVKTSFDAQPAGHHVHFDVAGLFRTFKAVNVIATPSQITAANTVTDTIHGGGVAGTMNIELVKNLRVIATGFYSYGGGRYIASTAGPDLVVRPDGTLSGVHASSGIGGFEYQPNPKFVIYGYYSAAYFGKNFSGNGTTGSPYVGYGFPGSSSSANRYIYEPTFGVHYTMWRNPAYGDLRLMTQYSYVSRTPWAVGPTSLATAHTSMVYINLRYDLP